MRLQIPKYQSRIADFLLFLNLNFIITYDLNLNLFVPTNNLVALNFVTLAFKKFTN